MAISPSRPAITVWTRHDLPRASELFRNDPSKTLAQNFKGKKFPLIGTTTEVTIESADFDGEYLVLQMSYPPGPAAVFVQPEELKRDDPRMTMRQEHKFYEKTGLYTARFGPLDESEKRRGFSLQFFSMQSMKKDASPVELRPNYSPRTGKMLGQSTPGPIDLE